IYFACSVACFQEFKRVNSITATCEYCKNERIIKDVKRVGGKDCCFCSDACKTLFCQELKGKWGKHCRSCSYCQSISKSLVTTPGEDTDIEFCSEACCSKYKMLLSHRPSWTFGSVCCPSASVAFWALLSLTTSAGWLKLYLHAGISHCFVVLGFMTFGSGDLGEVDGVDLSLQHKFPH
uniref:TRASH domain-containing protein n=1 Tax=Pundamilia nyererei TaxID=303518 RepID=A0A3B4FJS6_9CICH